MSEKRSRRRHSEEYKRKVVKRMRECKNILGLGREARFRREDDVAMEVESGGAAAAEAAGVDDGGGERDGPGGVAAGERAVEAAVGGEGAGAGFFQRSLAASRNSTPGSERSWRDAVYGFMGKGTESGQGGLSVERMCQLAEVSRAGCYRGFKEKAPEAEAMAVRAAVQQIALQHRRRYGYRRVTAELRRRGMAVNHKRVVRLMREDQLLALRGRPWLATTEGGHELPVYVNLARRMQVSAPDQLWVADITYIRLREECVYLAVVVDRFSRRALGWGLDRSLQTRLTVGALAMALDERRPAPGLVHHSDRGIQYAAVEYASLLAQHGITASMSRPANPYDNAHCESFIRTLKQEEISCHAYRDREDLRTHLREFIEDYYNRYRLHSALGYRTPAEFEAVESGTPSTTSLAASVMLSFPGMGKSISPMRQDPSPTGVETGKAGGPQDPPPHRIDESPADYSSASCSPAELASASSARRESDRNGRSK